MWEGSYGKEPFDLRLTVLRLMRCFDKILLFTLVGTLLFGGGYYVKNVLFRPAVEYAATSTYKVEYKETPAQSGDYYINEMTWNTHVQSSEFISAVQGHLTELATTEKDIVLGYNAEELGAVISAKLPSDLTIPTTTVTTGNSESAVLIARAVELAMTNEFADNATEVVAIRVIDMAQEGEEVPLDVRPGRAFVLSVILSFFFAAVLFLLKELGDDSVWLPSTLRHRYGVSVLGTMNSLELQENMSYLFRDKKKIAVCSVDDRVNVTDVVKALVEKMEGIRSEEATGASKGEDLDMLPLPTPLLCPEVCNKLREADGIMLVVPAGAHAGKPLEYVMEYLKQQDCKITAVILWNADEWLIDMYYCLRGKRITGRIRRRV